MYIYIYKGGTPPQNFIHQHFLSEGHYQEFFNVIKNCSNKKFYL